MRLYTKTGDDGRTSLIGRSRVSKNHPRVETYGQLDELNAAMGFAAVVCTDTEWLDHLRQIQHTLFDLGAEFANPDPPADAPAVNQTHIETLEQWIDRADEQLTSLKSFILPGGCELAARLHLARTTCRRAERTAVALAQSSPVPPTALIYLNRLSDLLFAWARWANKTQDTPDIVWSPRSGQSPPPPSDDQPST